jgi:hypothetical protein
MIARNVPASFNASQPTKILGARTVAICVGYGTGGGFAVCIDDESYEVSLQRNKIYIVLRDKKAERDGSIRVVDESGEDYLFSAERFVSIDVPPRVRNSLLERSRAQRGPRR